MWLIFELLSVYNINYKVKKVIVLGKKCSSKILYSVITLDQIESSLKLDIVFNTFISFVNH